jgi:hypothetical protein
LNRHQRLTLVPLEDRSLPTVFGIPWADPGHMTLSFVPDGTATPYGPSALNQLFGGNGRSDVWQKEILRAFEDWAETANVSIGVVADGGQPLGVSGAVQGDARFGDIRIAAAPLSSTLVADAAPFSWSGTTLSGDVVFNTNYLFTIGNSASAYDIYSVALHEAGHVLGLDHSTATDSAMNESYGYHTGLAISDVANLRTIYGARTPDAFEGSAGNDTIGRATVLARDGLLSSRYSAIADLTTATDVDYYKISVPALLGITGVAVRLQTAGLSLLAPKISVYDSVGRTLATTISSDPLNNDLMLQFAPSLLGGGYFIKVDRATSGSFDTGAYRVAADYLSLGSVLAPLGPLLSPILDGHTNDLLGLAQVLVPLPKPAPDSRFDFTYRGVIEDNADVDNYKIHAPSAPASGSLTLDVLVWALQTNGLDPRISVYNSATGAPIAFQVLANDAGVMSIQIPNASATMDYTVSIKARTTSGSHRTGSYVLAADFNQLARTNFDGVSTNALAPSATDSAALTINEAAIYEFALSAAMLQTSGGQAGGVVMTVTDATGNTVFSFAVDAGQTAVTTSRYLAIGTYTVTYTYRTVSGPPAGSIQYSLFMLQVTDGVGPYAPGGSNSSPSGGTTNSGGYTYAGSSTSKPSGDYYFF